MTLLDSGASLATANAWLISLPGNSGPQPGGLVAGAVYFSQLPEDRPDYLLAPVAPGLDTIVLLIVNYPQLNGPSLLAAFERQGHRWKAALSEISPRQLDVRPAMPGPEVLYLGAIDTYVRGDGMEGTFRLWALDSGAAREVIPALTGLEDPELVAHDSSITVSTHDFPTTIRGCIPCTRRPRAFTFDLRRTPPV
ncbi:MAG TPA: hypothetical protein VMG41_08990, partial [Gemmatimonadales bacterium]|nr:hypothetical protein [Gemmatimonadales bacterium]